MNYLAGLLAAVSILLGGTQAFAYDNNDGEAVISFYGNAQGKKYYSSEFGCTDAERGLIFYISYPEVTNGRIINDMDNAKISTLFGDIKIASKYKLILNNETPNRLVFTFGPLGEADSNGIALSGSFALVDKNTNTLIGKYSNGFLNYTFNTGILELSGYNIQDAKYRLSDVIVATVDGAVISIRDDGVSLLKGKHEFSFGLNPIYCFSGLAGQK